MLKFRYGSIFIFCLFVIIFYACAVKTQPNRPFMGPYPDSLTDLFDKNRLLATELCKLPEIQDGISDRENNSLKRLRNIYNNNQDLFNSVIINHCLKTIQ
jgi:hypothetical protein